RVSLVTPVLLVRDRGGRAPGLGRWPSCSPAGWTRCRTAGGPLLAPLSTRDALPRDAPARRATSRMLVRDDYCLLPLAILDAPGCYFSTSERPRFVRWFLGPDHAAVILADHEGRRTRSRGGRTIGPGREQGRLASDLVLGHRHAGDLRRVRVPADLAGMLDVDEHRSAIRIEGQPGDLAGRGTHQ